MLHLILDAILIVRKLVSAWSPLHLMSLQVLASRVVEVHLRLYLIAGSGETVIDEHASHSHSSHTVVGCTAWDSSTHWALHLWLLHVQALDLDQVLHVASDSVRELSFHRRCRLGGLLHLELHVIEYAVKIDRIELNWHFNGRILLEVDERGLSLFRVHDSCGTLDSLTFIHRDLLAVEDHQLDQSLDHDHSIVGLACDRIMNKRQIQ